MSALDYVLISSLLVIAYSYVIYPVAIAFITRKQTETQQSVFVEHPELTVVLSVHNGESLLRKRVDNILASDYPQGKLFVKIVSDGSTDRTEQIATQLSNEHENVSCLLLSENLGKSHAVSQAIQGIDTELTAFCDLRQLFEKDALSEMAKALSPFDVGIISGNLLIADAEGNPKADPGLYWKYEKWIRDSESKRNSLVGVTGAIYMAKTVLLPKSIPTETLLDDMYVPMTIIKKGFKAKMVNTAKAFDIPSSSISEEFKRKVRTLAGNFQLVKLLPWLANPKANPVFFEWFSHKITRLFVPYALIGLLISTTHTDSLFSNVLFWLQVSFYGYTMLSYIASHRSISLKFGSVCLSFVTLNAAAFLAGWKYMFKPASALWHKH